MTICASRPSIALNLRATRIARHSWVNSSHPVLATSATDTSLTDLVDCVDHVLALRDQNIDLPQLRDDLFRPVSLPCHCSPPGCQRDQIESIINPTGLRSGEFNGGGSLRNDARQSQVPTQRSVETENSAFQPEAQRPVRISIENCVNKDGSRPRKTRQCRVFGKIQGGKRGDRVD